MSPPARRRLKTFFTLLVAGGAVLLSATASAQAGASASGVGGQSAIPPAGARPAPRDVVNQPHFPKSSSERPKLLPVYFPASPPVLGGELPPVPAVRDKLWADLIPYTNELFFAPLSTRLSENDLNRRQKQRLDAYRAARTAALAELRALLESAQPAGTEARAAALAELAGKQEPLLTELTATADTFRREFYRGSLMVAGGDWNQYRNWQLGEEGSKRTPQEMLYDEFSVLRAAIFYQEGLAPEQRQLLREVIVELAEALGEREPAPSGDSFEPEHVLFFFPHGARLRLPGGSLTAELAGEVAAFTAAKVGLKRELREALFRLDRESNGKREHALEELAARQVPALAQLQAQADRLRPALAALPAVAQSVARPGLPAALAARIDAYLREKTDLQRAAQRQAEEPAPAAESAARKKKATATREALALFEEKNRARFAALAVEARAIREEVARHAAAHGGESPAKSVEALLADFARAFQHQQLQSLYRNYRTAIFEPGLSPAQRQLLFDAALAELDLLGVRDWQAVPE